MMPANLLLPSRRPDRTGFTLIELLTAMAVLGLLMLTVFSISNQASKAWLLGEHRTETFQAARLALDMIARELQGALATSNNPSATSTRMTFIVRPDAATVPGGDGGGAVTNSAPNDQLFFVAPAPDSASTNRVDLTEYGYLAVFASSDYQTMKSPGYYLLRHQVRSSDGGAWDFITNPDAWDATPAISTTNKVPLVENVLRFEVSTYPSLSSSVSDVLPRSVTIMLCVIDRRTAARLNAVKGGAALTSTELGYIPDNIDSLSAAVANVLRGNVRTFYRTVALQNYR